MNFRKIVAIVAAALMLFSILPISAMAAAGDEYELVTDIADLQIGDQIIIFAVNDNAVLSTTQNGNNRGKTDATPNGSVITLTDAMQVITVQAGLTEGTYAFNVGNGYLYAASSSRNYLRTETTLSANSSWSVAIAASGVATIKSTGTNTRNWMRYNKSSSIFACYGSGQNDIAIYKLPTGDECDHSDLSCGDECGDCGEIVDHVYDSNCDATCNECGEIRDIPGHEYSGALDNSCNNCGEIRDVVIPTDPTEIVDAAYALEQGEAFPKAVELTGIISSIDEVYSEQYSNITVTIDVIDADGNLIDGKAIQCYRMKGDGADIIAEGDTITVSGILKNYNGKIEFDTGCSLVSYVQTGCAHEYDYECSTTCNICGEGERDVVCVNEGYACQDGLCIYCGNDVAGLGCTYDNIYDADCNYCGEVRDVPEMPDYATITFDDTSKRTEQTTEIQIWTENGIVVTNNKGGSTSNIIDSSNPVRFYKNSEVVIAYAGITTIEFYCNTAAYATAMANSIGDAATVNDKVVTITFDEAVDSYSVTLSGGQVRVDSITVYAESSEPECEHEYAYDCSKNCKLCGEETRPEAEHSYFYPCDPVCQICYEETNPDAAHNVQHVEAKDATCTENGNTEYWYCSNCGAAWADEAQTQITNQRNVIVPAAGHQYFYPCDPVCMVCYEETNPDAAHNVQHVEAVAPTCTAMGNIEYWYCSDCGGAWSDEACTQITNQMSVKLPMAEHEYFYPCDPVCMNCYEVTNPDAAHNVQHVEAVAATCYENGNVEYWYCETCGSAWTDEALTMQTNVMNVVVPMGHGTITHVEAVAPTCDAEGNIEYWYCEACGQAWLDEACTLNTNLLSVVLPMAHGTITHVEAKDATCTALGNIEYWYCEACGQAWLDADCTLNTNLKAVVLPMAEHEYFYPCDPACMNCYEITNPDATHNIVAVEAVAATCDTNGNIAYWYCSDCGGAWADEALTQVTNRFNVIVPAAHSYDDNCDFDCNACGEYRNAPHTLTTHVEGKVPANCKDTGYDEYWICEDCNGCFQDNGWGGYSEVNPAWLYYTGEHVRPEDAIVCAVVPCELCGEDTYGEACDRGEAPVCQDATCVNCGETVWGWGCNYNTGDEEIPLPLCQAGTCVYCGTEYEYLYECENGAWAPCQDGECAYGCGKQYPATAYHVLEDCTVDGNCSVCWSYIPAGEHTYDHSEDVDCNVCGAIRAVDYMISTFVGNSISEDVNGLAFKYTMEISGIAIMEGKYTQADYTNATTKINSVSEPVKVLGMGAIVSNNYSPTLIDYVDGKNTVDIPAVYLSDLEADSASFAVRVINIPDKGKDTDISVRPYLIYEDQFGNVIYWYGLEDCTSYNAELANP